MLSRIGRRAGVALVGGLAGASFWISLGTLALTDAAAGTRVGALPPLWAAAVLAAAGAAAAVASRAPLARLWPLALTVLMWLPWLPVRVPAAFLMWEGPFEAVVWTTVALALVAGWIHARGTTWPSYVSDGRRAPWTAMAAALVCWLAGAVAVAERIPAGDEPHYLIITQSLLRDADLRIENNHLQGDYLQYYPSDLRRPDFMRRGTDGQIYSVHMPGLSMLVLPAFLIAGYWGAVFFVALVAAAGSALAWHAAWRLTASVGAAWIGWAAIVFSPPMFFGAFTIFPDTVGATIAMFVVWLLVRLELGDEIATPPWLISAGAALGSLPWLHTRFALVAAGLGAALALRLLARPDRWRACALFLAVPVIAAISWFGYFWIIYGAPDPSLPYNGLGQNRIATLRPGIPGLLFDQQFGLVANAPVFAVAILGAIPLWRRSPRLVLELGAVSIAYFLAVASYGMWWAGHSAPARFLLVLLWPAALPTAWVWHTARSAATRAAIVGAILVGAALVIGRSAVSGGLLLYNSRDGYDLLLDWASRTVNLPLAFPSLHRDSPAAALGDVAAWVASFGIAYAVLVWMLRNGRGGTARAWTLSAGAAALGLMIGATIVWSRHEERVLTPSTSQLAFLQAWNPGWQTRALTLRPTRGLDSETVPTVLELTSSSRGAPGPGVQPMLQLPLVPAGRYRVSTSASPSGGELVAHIGRSANVVEAWPAGSQDALLDLPVQVHSVTIDGGEAHRSTQRAALRPLQVVPPRERLTGGYARRAATYGSARVFFLDDDAFMEEPGFWTRGEADTDIIVERREGRPLRMQIRNGAVPNELTVVSGGWRVSLSLLPEHAEEISLPQASGSRPGLVTLTTRSGFRPAEVHPGNGDFRKLGVWIAFP